MPPTLVPVPSWKNILRHSTDWTREDLHEAVALRDRMLHSARLQNLALLSEMLYSAKRERGQMVSQYANPYKRVLAMESTVATTYDIRKMLRLADNGGEGTLARRKRCEALMLFDQAVLLTGIDTENSYYSLSEDLEEFLELLATRFFVRGRDRTVDLEIGFNLGRELRVGAVAIHDPNDPTFQVRGIPRTLEQHSLLTRRESQLPCRVLSDGRIVLFDARLKNQHETYLKVLWRLSKGKEDPFDVTDRSGIRLVVPTVEEARALTHLLCIFAQEHGGRAGEPTDNLDADRPGDSDNDDSSVEFKSIQFYIDWKHRRHEVHVQTFMDYYRGEYDLSDPNHEIYKLRRCLGLHFPSLFPTEIYGIDWADPRVRTFLLEEKRRQLKARIDSN